MFKDIFTTHQLIGYSLCLGIMLSYFVHAKIAQRKEKRKKSEWIKLYRNPYKE